MVVFNFAKWIWINTKSQKDEYGEFFASFIPEKKPTVCRLSCDGDYTKNIKTFAGYYAQIIQKISCLYSLKRLLPIDFFDFYNRQKINL